MDVMGQPEHKRIRVRADDRERINRLREGPDDTQAAVVSRALDALEGETDGGKTEAKVWGEDVPAPELPDEVADQLNRIESAATAAESNTGSIQNALKREGIGR
jgi:hypothetical protein